MTIYLKIRCNHLKSYINIHNFQTLSSYFTENTLHLSYKNQSVRPIYKNKVNTKVSLFIIKDHVMKTYKGMGAACSYSHS
jgi:hypothetical protein